MRVEAFRRVALTKWAALSGIPFDFAAKSRRTDPRNAPHPIPTPEQVVEVDIVLADLPLASQAIAKPLPWVVIAIEPYMLAMLS
jgi:hypothetical protein